MNEGKVWCIRFCAIVTFRQVFSRISLKSPFPICLPHGGPLRVRLFGSSEVDESRIRVSSSRPTIVASRQEVTVAAFYGHFPPDSNQLPLRFLCDPIFYANCTWINPTTLSAKSHIASILSLKSCCIEPWQICVDNIPLGPSIISIRLMDECKIRSRASSGTIIASGQELSIIRLERILPILVNNWSPKGPCLMIWLVDKGSIRIRRQFPAIVASCKVIPVTSFKGYLITNNLESPCLFISCKNLGRSERSRVRISSFSAGMAYLQELPIISLQMDSSCREIHSGIMAIVEMDGLNQEGCSQQKSKLFFEHN